MLDFVVTISISGVLLSCIIYDNVYISIYYPILYSKIIWFILISLFIDILKVMLNHDSCVYFYFDVINQSIFSILLISFCIHFIFILNTFPNTEPMIYKERIKSLESYIKYLEKENK